MTIEMISEGALVRIPAYYAAGEETHWSFRTDHIEQGFRVGSVLAQVRGVCELGCHVVLGRPENSDPDEVATLPIELVLPLEDNDRAKDGSQQSPMGKGSTVQGMRVEPERSESRATVREALPPPGPFAKREAQSLKVRYARVLRRIFQRSGNHDHDGTRRGCVQCAIIRDLGLDPTEGETT